MVARATPLSTVFFNSSLMNLRGFGLALALPCQNALPKTQEKEKGMDTALGSACPACAPTHTEETSPAMSHPRPKGAFLPCRKYPERRQCLCYQSLKEPQTTQGHKGTERSLPIGHGRRWDFSPWSSRSRPGGHHKARWGLVTW